MRYATPLKPRSRRRRTKAVVDRWRRRRDDWIKSLGPSELFQKLFDHVPGVYLFAKDREGHTMFASRGILERYRMRDESEMLGLTDFDINPVSMAESYVGDDALILSGKKKTIERIELWFDRQGIPDWFLVTKLPLLDRRGRPQGVMGLLRRPDMHERQVPVFQTVAKAVEHIRRDYARPILIAEISTACGLSLRQLQRRFKSAFGIPPQEFLIRTRVLAAWRLLDDTTLSMAEIASRCGFEDQSAFAQQFRKRTGFSPNAYRRGKTVRA